MRYSKDFKKNKAIVVIINLYFNSSETQRMNIHKTRLKVCRAEEMNEKRLTIVSVYPKASGVSVVRG